MVCSPRPKDIHELADAIEVELVKCIGDEIKPMSDADRSKFANCLKEIGRALR